MSNSGQPASPSSQEPTYRLAIVVATFGVEEYLPAFLESLKNQSVPLDQIQPIFVDDGSPDRCAELIEQWRDQVAPHTVLVRKENGGASSARNAGLPFVDAEWVSFPDPDDKFDHAYMSEVFGFLDGNMAKSQPVDMLMTRILMLDDATGELTDTHALRRRFHRGTQVVDLDRYPEYIHLQAPTGIYRTERVRLLGLEFEPDVRPNFEDAYFTAIYLASITAPRIGVLADAHYHYRRRVDGSSLVQSSWHKEEKYVHLLEVGYLRLLRTLHASRGYVPTWAQNLVLYDLLFYFRSDERIHSSTGWVTGELADSFHGLVAKIMSFIDTETIDGFDIVPTSRTIKLALIIGYKGARLRPDSVPLVRIDSGREIVQIRYFFGGSLPVEDFRVRGLSLHPIYAKIRDVVYLDRALMHERIVWLPADGTIRLFLDSRPMPLTMGTPPDPVYVQRPAALWQGLTNRKPPPARPVARALGLIAAPPSTTPPTSPAQEGLAPISGATEETEASRSTSAAVPAATRPQRRRGTIQLARAVKRRLRRVAGRTRSRVSASISRPTPSTVDHDRRLLQAARSDESLLAYGGAWVFTDRDTQAQDNAEHLYRHVAAHHPDINAWFVISRSSPDWTRLESEGFRLIDHGSDEHVKLMLNAAHLISSQADYYTYTPYDRKRFGPYRFRFTFLQHGVIKDDLSRWVNNKPIGLFITSSTDEHQSIAGDHTPYIFTEKETRLTGLPRHDRLLALSRVDRRPATLLVAPTWRQELMGAHVNAAGGSARKPVDGFETSDYATNWLAFLSSERLREVAVRHGLQIAFLPHPNMHAYLDGMKLPAHVKLCSYFGIDIQEVLADTALMVTDYSSLAFETAYIERPVVYFQFDQQAFFGGSHSYRRGTWSYEAHGFGPVTTDIEAALSAVEQTASGSLPQQVTYRERMVEAFPFRDGGCSERVVQAVQALTRPLDVLSAYKLVTSPGGDRAGEPERISES